MIFCNIWNTRTICKSYKILNNWYISISNYQGGYGTGFARWGYCPIVEGGWSGINRWPTRDLSINGEEMALEEVRTLESSELEDTAEKADDGNIISQIYLWIIYLTFNN